MAENTNSRLRRQLSARKRLAETSMMESATGSRLGSATSKSGKDPSPLITKPKLNSEDLLKIMDRLENGNYQKGLGREQFYQEKEVHEEAKMRCKQNLKSVFERLGPCTSRMSMQFAQTEPVSQTHPNLVLTSSKAFEDLWMKFATEVEENYSAMPQYIKKFDTWLVLLFTTIRHLLGCAELKPKTDFEKMLPQKLMVRFLANIERSFKAMDKLNKKSSWEMVDIFCDKKLTGAPNTAKKVNVLQCDVRDRERVLKSLMKLNGLLQHLTNTNQQLKEKPIDLRDIISNLELLLSGYEGQLKLWDTESRNYYELSKKILFVEKYLERDDDNKESYGLDVSDSDDSDEDDNKSWWNGLPDESPC